MSSFIVKSQWMTDITEVHKVYMGGTCIAAFPSKRKKQAEELAEYLEVHGITTIQQWRALPFPIRDQFIDLTSQLEPGLPVDPNVPTNNYMAMV